MSTQTAEVLRQARALIEDPERWSVKYMACDAAGRCTDHVGPDAVSWCAMGALERIARSALSGVSIKSAYDALYATGVESIGDLNDREGHGAVLAMYDRAIAAEEARVAA